MTEPIPVDQLPYAEALAELESILDRLEHGEPDVDRLAVDVGRATDLIAHLRLRIGAARLRVEEVVGGLGPAEAGTDTTGGGEEGTDDA